jgi:hypothetical protein
MALDRFTLSLRKFQVATRSHYDQCDFYGKTPANSRERSTFTPYPILAAQSVWGVEELSRDKPPCALQSGVSAIACDCSGHARGAPKRNRQAGGQEADGVSHAHDGRSEVNSSHRGPWCMLCAVAGVE